MPAQGNLAVIRGVGRCDQSPLTGLSPDGALLIRPDTSSGGGQTNSPQTPEMNCAKRSPPSSAA